MVTTGAARRQEQPQQEVRPFNPTRHLDQVTDLLRVVFREELGRREAAWLQEMDTIGALTPVVWLLQQVNIAIGRLFHGFVWIEDGRLVGNVTISRVTVQHWLISNVAVHPDYRRRGIGRDLMEASVDWIRERRARWVTLEVRRDNEPAKSLYFNMGFVVVEGTAEMERDGASSVSRVAPPASYELRPAHSGDGPQLYELARDVTPELAQRIEPLRRRDYEVGGLDRVVDVLRRLIGLPATTRWIVTTAGGEVIAELKLRTDGYDHQIKMLVHPEGRGALEEAMLTRALDTLPGRRGTTRAKVDADHAAAVDALHDHGFREIRTLDRMALELNPPRRIPVHRNS